MKTTYTVLERLGGGGQAEVFRGTAESIKGFKKAVAITHRAALAQMRKAQQAQAQSRVNG